MHTGAELRLKKKKNNFGQNYWGPVMKCAVSFGFKLNGSQAKICVVKVANLKSCMLLAKLSCGMGHNSYGEAA